ncbi:MAG TPA: type II toxin-antitoxin system VapC family toxin [Caulobacteraceae bacterium]
MDLPDVNVLVYAFRDDLEHHAQSRGWLDRAVADNVAFGLSPLTLSALVRITTNARSFRQPSTHDEAFGFCEDLMGQSNCQLVEPGRRHWAIFRDVCRNSNITGPKVSDAWYAALAIEHGCEWITLDRDFARFPGLKCRAPGAA